jgi:hypothetical protein
MQWIPEALLLEHNAPKHLPSFSTKTSGFNDDGDYAYQNIVTPYMKVDVRIIIIAQQIAEKHT